MDSSIFQFFPKKNIIFISFEGIEGCGKSTQIKLLEKYLKQNTDYQVHSFREPGGTDFGEKLRSAMLNSDKKVAPLSEAHLFAASRCQLLTEKVLPLLNSDKNIVIYDRYTHSSIAYQGFGSKLGAKTVIDIHKAAPLNYLPHLTFYLEIDYQTSLQRQASRNSKKDYFESKESDFHRDLINGFDQMKNHFETFHTVDGSKKLEEVHANIIQRTLEIINEQ